MVKSWKIICALALLIIIPSLSFAARAPEADQRAMPFADPYLEKKTHDVGKAWLTMTNYGFFGNQDDQRYVSFEFPGGSNIEYLFQGAVWVGAYTVAIDSTTMQEVRQGPYVSVGAEGWAGEEEFFPGTTQDDSILVLSIRDNDLGAVSEQDFICKYTDEMTALSDAQHTPLGIEITQRSYAWSYSYAEDFIIIDYTIKNIRPDGKSLQDMYVGLYIDADVGHTATPAYAQDDITGFRDVSVNPATQDTFAIESAWIADGDGDFNFANPVTGVSGTRVVYPPMDDVSFNWWISDTDAERDWGPDWAGEFPYGPWAEAFGTPDDDEQKYYLMSNGNREGYLPDFDQELSENPPPEFVACPANCDDIADGEDTRYLFSFGPVGNTNAQGIKEIAVGDSAKLTIGYFAAEDFHRLGQTDIHDFTDFDLNARWVRDVYDNPSYDTPQFDDNNDGFPETGDGFYGEDTGCDGIPNTGDEGEGDNQLRDCEDALLPTRPAGVLDRPGYMNGKLELGDGVPDFNGPPPPLAPAGEVEGARGITLSQFTKNGELWVQLRWTTRSFFSSDVFALTDPLTLGKGDSTRTHPFFDRYPMLRGNPTDFEGFRIYKSTTGIVSEYEFLAEYDLEDHDYAEYLAAEGEIDPDDVHKYYLGYDIGFDTDYDASGNVIFEFNEETEIFTFNYGPVAPNWPLYFSVTAFDHGIPAASVVSLESSPNANSVLIWPSPDPQSLSEDAKPMVIPNPYRIDVDYTNNSNRYRWDDWNNQGFSEHTRRIDFVNLPAECDIRIYTLFGDLVDTIEHRIENGIRSSRESWGMITRNRQSLASGVYYFSVEDLETGDIEIGKFVVIR